MTTSRRFFSTCALGFAILGSLPAGPAWAAGHLVVVVSAASSVAVTSKDDVADIFNGKGAGSPLDLPESSPMRDRFYKAVLGRSAAQTKAYWAKLVFTGRGKPPREAKSADELKQLLRSDPKLVGYIDQGDVDGSVKVIFTVSEGN